MVRTLQSLFVVIGQLLASMFVIAGQAQQVGVASRRNSIAQQEFATDSTRFTPGTNRDRAHTSGNKPAPQK